jgi:hypothetical protein
LLNEILGKSNTISNHRLCNYLDFGKQINPHPSMSIGLLIVVPFAVVLNLVIALILYFTKRELAPLFIINSVITGILIFYLFEKGINRYQNERLESWKFKLQDTTYVITHWKLEKTFSMSESTNQGSSTGFLEGKIIKSSNQYYLTTDSTEYIIKNEYFYKFKKNK